MSQTPVRHKSATNDKPEVSIIVAVFNTARYIKEALASILAQQGLNFEIVAVNDGSTDTSLARVLEVDDNRLTVLSLPQNVGLYHARNAAMEHARAPWIMIFDSDDVMLPACLAAYFHATEASGCAWGYCWLDLMDAEGRGIGLQQCALFDTLTMLQRNLVPDPMSLVKRDVLLDMGGYRTRFRIAESYDLRLRLLERGDPFCYPQVCVRYRRHETNITVRRRDQGSEILKQWKESICSKVKSGQQSDRVRLLCRCFELLEAFSGKRWAEVVTIADSLLEAGLASVELERRLIVALRESGNLPRAMEIALRLLGAGDTRLLPAETAWLMARAVELAALKGDKVLLRNLMPSAENICRVMQDKELAAVLQSVRGRFGGELAS